jgi:hypothetical protein
MAGTLSVEVEILEEPVAATQATGRSTLTDRERRRILIAAAAAAAAGAPVRILDIRPAEEPGSRWSRKGRLGNPVLAPRPARPRRQAAPEPSPNPEPEPQEEEQTP